MNDLLGVVVGHGDRCQHCGDLTTSGGCARCNSSRTFCGCGFLLACGCGMKFEHSCPMLRVFQTC
jgi:hypothetical protein